MYELIIKRGEWTKPSPWLINLELGVARSVAAFYRQQGLRVMVVPVGTFVEGQKRAPRSPPPPYTH